MGFKVQTFDFKIGDTGVYQSDGGVGDTYVSISGTISAAPCETIINIAEVSSDFVGVLTPPATTVVPETIGTWSVGSSYDAPGSSYPMANGTTVLTVTAIVAY